MDNASNSRDLVDRLFAALDSVLDTFHDKVLRPIIMVGRFVAFGFILALVSALILIFALIVLLRVSDVYIFASHQWASYLLLGFIFTSVGMVIWRKRRPVQLRK